VQVLARPYRFLKNRLHRPAASVAQAPSILDAYCTERPSPQTALDLFRGEWVSKLPPPYENLNAGQLGLFEDDRIAEGLNSLGGVAGQTVLELGPLEGGHSCMLERAGAKSVLAIESNSRAFLKCLIVKELLGLERVYFQCGDFLEYLRRDPLRFDFVLASGVLYHQRNPVELIRRLAAVTDRVLVWTHYYDEAIMQASATLAPKFPRHDMAAYEGFRHTLHRQEYQSSLAHPGYCGGSADHSAWLSRDDLLSAFRHFGFTTLRLLREDPQFPNGPCMLFTARKSA
jgi:hypothetical protein